MADANLAANSKPKRGRLGGRQKGTPNKIAADVRAAILAAFDKLGGKSYLVKVGQENPQVFCSLLGKILPTQVTGPNGGAVQVTWLPPQAS